MGDTGERRCRQPRCTRWRREFALGFAQARGAAVLAERIRGGQGAWAWQQEAIDWQGNEVTLSHAGEPLRIDRLVRRRDSGAWWVLDYKSAAAPATRPGAGRADCGATALPCRPPAPARRCTRPF